MLDYFVCSKDCTYAGQRWYPGDKMPASYAKDGICPPHFMEPAGYREKKAAEEKAKHQEEVKNRLDSIRTDDPLVKGMTQRILNETLGKKGAKIPKTPLGENWVEGQKGPGIPPVVGPQPGSTMDSKIQEKRGPGRPPKNALDRIIED
jgi:hypothetical protein